MRRASEEIAKPTFCESEMMAVVMPTTLPSASRSDPPELPGFIGTVICMTPAMRWLPSAWR